MHDKGKKSCPICTEEMDLTDQQLKPCKCGYEICVWCWHHIMEISEKDGGGGRCPACRAPYDKKHIVAMAANCQRLVAEMTSQRKKKMQKLKPKSSQEKNHLSDIRVIQRNMVYIMGLPLNIADEDLLQHREYFGRYGKVLKVSISRTATGLIQHSENNYFCVYVTYSKEAEAIRCIQSVHCFVLEGRCLRACYGTTKYCHAWLRNLPCRNRDCMYLHDYGSQEDSFTKDDLALALARSRVHQIVGATNNLNWRVGNVFPPPEDDCRHMSPASKVACKSSSDKTASESHTKVSCSGGPMSSVAPSAVPSWAMRVSGSLPPVSSPSCSDNLANRKVGASNGPEVPVSVVNSTERSILNTRTEKDENSSQVHSGGVFIPSEMNKHNIGGNSQTYKSDDNKEVIAEKLLSPVLSSLEDSLGPVVGNDEDMVAPAVSTSFRKHSKQQCNFNTDKAISLNSNGDVQGLCSELSSISMRDHLEDSYSIPDSDRLYFTRNSMDSSIRQHLQQDDHYSDEDSTTPALWEDIIVDDMLNLDHKQPKFCKGTNNLPAGSCSPGLRQNVDQSSHHIWEQDQLRHEHHLDKPFESLNQHLETGSGKHVESKNNVNMVASDIGESSIISNILSLELDACEDSLVKLLAESEEPCRPIKTQTLLKVQDKSQSSFAFARQDDFMNGASDLEQTFGITRHASSGNFASNGLIGNEDTLTAKYKHVPSSNSAPDKFIGISKAHASSPPGFSMSSRIPPPGFSSGRVTHDYNTPAKHPQQYGLPSGNIGRTGNGQFNNDAVIMEAFRTGMLAERLNNSTSFNMRQSLLPPYSPAEQDAARLMLLMQQSIPSQNLRLPDLAENRFSLQNDAYSSRFLDQFQPNNRSIYEHLHSQPFSSNVFTSSSQPTWHDTNSFSGLPMPQVLDNQRMGFNNFMPSSYENIKF
ncbi:unnamed protein product [Lupinus luteus]|uniref:CCR4-NOT transcription complex subunit 4 n=1 Tax=Lupinus luteus TaxID=3873 RepID=A0AAV1WM31_LUPLU